MKRKLKSLFRVAICFITVGAVMVIVGLALGGVGELSKEVTGLVHVVRVGVSETVARIPLLERVTNFNGFTVVLNKDEVSVSVNEEYETIEGDYTDLELASADEVVDVDISILNGVCRIMPSENGKFGVKSTGAQKYQCYVSEGTLYLSALPKDWGKSEDSEIILYIPEGCEFDSVYLFCSAEAVVIDTSLKGQHLDISSVCGENVCNADLDFDRINLSAGVGSLSVNTLIAESFNLEVGTSDVEILQMDVGCVEVSLGMGNILMKGRTSGDVVLNCGMGCFEMVLDDSRNAYNYDISGSAESVRIGTDTLAGMVMERWIDNGADKKITMSCAMGSVEIGFEE